MRMVLALSSLLLVGCATDRIVFERGAFALAYADMKSAYAVAVVKITEACVAGKLDKDTCVALAEMRKDVERWDKSVRRAILVPEATLDWEVASQYMSTIVSIAGKLL